MQADPAQDQCHPRLAAEHGDDGAQFDDERAPGGEPAQDRAVQHQAGEPRPAGDGRRLLQVEAERGTVPPAGPAVADLGHSAGEHGVREADQQQRRGEAGRQDGVLRHQQRPGGVLGEQAVEGEVVRDRKAHAQQRVERRVRGVVGPQRTGVDRVEEGEPQERQRAGGRLEEPGRGGDPHHHREPGDEGEQPGTDLLDAEQSQHPDRRVERRLGRADDLRGGERRRPVDETDDQEARVEDGSQDARNRWHFVEPPVRDHVDGPPRESSGWLVGAAARPRGAVTSGASPRRSPGSPPRYPPPARGRRRGHRPRGRAHRARTGRRPRARRWAASPRRSARRPACR